MALYDYIAAVFFAAFGLFIGSMFILTSKLISKRATTNPIKAAPYESGERSVGRSRDVDTEYMPFFMIFLPFELISVLILLWGATATAVPYASSIEMLGLVSVSTVLAVFGYKLTSNRG